MDPFTTRRLTPGRIAAIYLAVAFLALVVSDFLLPTVLSEELLHPVQGIKGAVEIVLTAGLLFGLLRWNWRQLRLVERAMDAAPVGITIADAEQPDNPLVYANERFTALTGYEGAAVRGRNCRFLQGPETDPETVADLRAAVDAADPVSVDVLNYRRNGSGFWNKVDVAPIRGDSGAVTNYVGFQTDVTERKVRTERVGVLNRVLRHNFRNKLTVIAGQLELLRDDLESPPPSIDTIQRAVADLESLTETVRMQETALDSDLAVDTTLAIDQQLVVLVDAFRDRYPEAGIDLSMPDDPPAIETAGVVRAVEEAIENAIKHNPRDSPRVDVSLSVEDDGWLTIVVDDDGPGIPTDEIDVLSEGERPLKHAQRLGIWSIHWMVSLAGGSMDVATADLGGTRVIIRVPSVDA
jgi:PAS domain S-box-containing protein